jgi:hypothetical protein
MFNTIFFINLFIDINESGDKSFSMANHEPGNETKKDYRQLSIILSNIFMKKNPIYLYL